MHIFSRFRRLMPSILALAMIVMTGVGMYAITVVRRDMAGQLSREFERDIRDRVDSWESDLFEQLTTWAEVAAANTFQGARYQSQLRQTAPWLDALYIWSPAQQVSNNGRLMSITGKLIFPDPAQVESLDLIRRVRCLTRARIFAGKPDTTIDQAVNAWRTWCQREHASTRMLALSEGINILRRNERWEDVIDVLNSDGLAGHVTLSGAANLGIPPFRAVVLSIQRAEALRRLGRDDEASALDFRTGMEIAQLDAPDAEALLHLVAYPLQPRVEAHGNPQRIALLTEEANRAARRVHGYREVRDNLLRRRVPENPRLAAENSRLVRDQYGDTPFLLFTHWATSANIGVALQLDQKKVLENFLHHMGRYSSHLVITDSTGQEYAASRQGGTLAVEVPFTRTLTHLRVSMRDAPLRAQLRRLDNLWLAGTLLLGLVLLGALGALYTVVQTSRTQRLLLVRQKEFATRVTHELKTPLAGIKVMAEILELGHYNGSRERASMARSIVRETDNLTHRVNEILAVTKERVLRAPILFDPEEPLFEAIDQWGPRMQVADIRLEAELNPTDEILGDPEAFRDAVACLLDNALKYRREDNESVVSLVCDQDGDHILISVTDNGLGVPEAMRTAIFEQFVRVEGNDRGKSGGHGLGLAQVVQIIGGHKGTVRCEDGIDGGARFVIRVPSA